MSEELIVIGGGLAGSEAAWQAARRGIKVALYEMRPGKMTEAHRTGSLAELVCSNSLRSNDLHSGPGLLKRELTMAGSLIMEAAEASQVPAGSALAVDRNIFADFISKKLSGSPGIRIVREEVVSLPAGPAIIATGPLTSDAMADSLTALLGGEHLYFYDAIAPIIDSESIDYSKVYRASRYGKGGDDYINCPMNKDEYDNFYDALIEADRVTPREFENQRVFEGCMPVEVMASRGRDTLRFGPMKPVGLVDPRSGKEPYAVVQLRVENREMTSYNIVGFQTRLKWPEQRRVFQMIPGLGNSEFLRFGSIHRNTFINSPLFLSKDLTLKNSKNIFVAGQISGVEGYIESTAMGLVAGINAAFMMKGKDTVDVPSTTSHGALIRHITESEPGSFQPSNINFGLFPVSEALMKIRDKKKRKAAIVDRALMDWGEYVKKVAQ
ncbi:Methylenetetrahydrofolate--tRNA-(uracil-5-)-methyltransferase TrmFO [Candidatus Sulfobium mesophilum]|uniref:Methylenetetrahydrofolate--tRNA-(uracil-5-)-methyltransferase TrmFO n=1 Tax=Candidatus Sulfobium mesophilum TaxID=2016548 RepID=A0A2U3QL57_9BACT|nr:Methylenetetrahydrofolate--tRNA-(uracil-5-)-methyltransferase TrmFO [Candidatus Sulfobium mesophilum]